MLFPSPQPDKTSTAAQAASPTLTDMEMPPTPPLTGGLSSQPVRATHPTSSPTSESFPSQAVAARGRLMRFLPDHKKEAFVGPMPSNLEDTFKLLRRECPSLRDVADDQIVLQIGFDGVQNLVSNVLFRVHPCAFPRAVTEPMPLLVVHQKTLPPTPIPRLPAVLPVANSPPRIAPSPPEQRRSSPNGSPKSDTWYDLVRQGATLGVTSQDRFEYIPALPRPRD